MPAKKNQSRIEREEQKEKQRPQLRERQAKFRKEHGKDSVRLELRVSKETDALLIALAERQGNLYKTRYAAELLETIVKQEHSKLSS